MNQKDTATNASDTHDTLIGGRVVVAPDIEGGVAVGARKVQSETPRTVRFAHLLEISTNHDLRAGHTTLYGH